MEDKRKSNDVRFKLWVVEVGKKKSIAGAAREFKVDRKRVRVNKRPFQLKAHLV